MSETVAPAIRKRNAIVPFSVILVLAWLAVIGVAEWHYAMAETEPPVWDALSYAAKAAGFWEAVHQGRIFNPLNIPPTVRPPGTIIMSYPLGFSHAFNAYYFRSTFLPIVLLICAIYVACDRRVVASRRSWIVAVLALALCGMPALYQFQGNDSMPLASFWGLVDNFLAGVAAIAVAAAIRSVSTRSLAWALTAAFAAALCPMIKPSGFLVMALVGATWLILVGSAAGWSPRRLWTDRELGRFFVKGLIGAAAIFSASLAAASFSEYLSAANFIGGSRALAILKSVYAVPLDFHLLYTSAAISLGKVVPLVICAGIVAALFTPGERGLAAAAILCVAVGLWFWLVESGPTIAIVRYFLPFGIMAVVLVAPSIGRRMQSLSTGASIVIAAVLLTPTSIVTLLLLTPQPSVAWQRALHVNLSAGAYRAETDQAHAFLAMVQAEGNPRSVYMLHFSSAARNFNAVVDYWTYFDKWRVRITTMRPMDWSRSSTFRLAEIAAADYILWEPILDDAERQSVLQLKSVENFPAEMRLMQAWFSSLGSEQGLVLISETRLRLLRIVDRERFQQALQKLRATYQWREEFLAANPQP